MSTRFATSCSLISYFTLIGALTCSGCATQWTPALRPRAVPPGQGALFGRVQVANKDLDVTAGCTVGFTNERGVEKGRAPLGETGWVFMTVGTGRTHLSNVRCFVPRVGAAGYSSSEHSFDVPGAGKIVYFGHFLIDLHAEPDNVANILAATGSPLLGAIVAAADAAAAGPPTSPTVDVLDRLEEAKNIYGSKYGADAGSLQPVASIARRATMVPVAAPTIAAGFELRKDITTAETKCTAAGNTWQKIDDTSYSCSGPAAKLEVPVTVGLTSCKASVCRVALNGNPGGAAWSVVLPRFAKLRQGLVQAYGNAHQRSADPLDDCKDGLDACLAAGRVRTSAKWEWPDGSNISITLDGGPLDGGPFDGVPSFTLVYSSGESVPAKP